MNEKGSKSEAKKIDTQEFEIPETVFSCDIDNRVFQGIILQCLANIEGISLIEGNFIDNILGRSGPESIKGIATDQDTKNQTLDIKVEVNILYGNSIPDKAEEIQSKIADELNRLTGLHVSSIHVIFRNVISYDQKKGIVPLTSSTAPPPPEAQSAEDYNDEF